jgi:hypothetical protein
MELESSSPCSHERRSNVVGIHEKVLKAVSACAMKSYGWAEVKLHLFLTKTIDCGKRASELVWTFWHKWEYNIKVHLKK